MFSLEEVTEPLDDEMVQWSRMLMLLLHTHQPLTISRRVMASGKPSLIVASIYIVMTSINTGDASIHFTKLSE